MAAAAAPESHAHAIIYLTPDMTSTSVTTVPIIMVAVRKISCTNTSGLFALIALYADFVSQAPLMHKTSFTSNLQVLVAISAAVHCVFFII